MNVGPGEILAFFILGHDVELALRVATSRELQEQGAIGVCFKNYFRKSRQEIPWL